MNYRGGVRLVKLGLSAVSRSSDPGRDCMPELQLGLGTSLFHVYFTYFHFRYFSACLLPLFMFFRSCCSHALVFGKTLVHEFHIFYSHSEWYLLSPGIDFDLVGEFMVLN